MSVPSLAESAVDALAAVRAMDANITNDHPQRHAVRYMKRLAETVLSDAFRQAHSLAWQAQDLEALIVQVRDDCIAERAAMKGKP